MNTIVASHKSTKNSNIWVVSVSGQEEGRQFCKSAASALRYMFILKARTGANISQNCIERLSFEIKRTK